MIDSEGTKPMPHLRHLVENLRILRQWAEHMHASADFGPLLGAHLDCRDLWISAGWSYGISGAPAGGDLLARTPAWRPSRSTANIAAS